MINIFFAMIVTTLIIILSLLLPTYTSEEEKPKSSRIRSKFDPIAIAIRRLRS